MTITQLKYVLAVAEHQNFTKAAKNVFVTQPTLSMQIQKLEDELDIQIFDRAKKPIQLTEVGKKLVVQARNIVNESDRMRDVVDQQKGFIGGEFTLGIIPTIMPTLLPMFLGTYIKKFPKVKLKIVELPTDSIIENLLEGHLDAAIAATPLNNENIKERVLYYEPFIGYVPQNHKLTTKKKLTPSDLDTSLDLSENAQENLLPFEEPSPAREVSLIYPKSELKIQIINSLKDTIASIVKGAIAFQNVEIVSPLSKK